MLKFVIPAIVFFLVVLFWENINEKIYQKFKIKINLIIVMAALLFLLAVNALFITRVIASNILSKIPNILSYICVNW